MAQAGAIIVLNGTDKTRIQTAVDQMHGEGLNSTGFTFDVRDEKSVNESVYAIEKQFGQIDILVNNAGIMIRKTVGGI